MSGPKQVIKKPNKKITISILPVLNSRLDKNEFIKSLEEKIYSELNKIN